MKRCGFDNKDWTIDWFNSAYYHILYKHRDINEAKRFINNLIQFLEKNNMLAPLSRVLDLACGRGRHAVYLAEKGFEVTGVDISDENILYAKASGKHNFPHLMEKQIVFRRHDMRKVMKVKKFDAVFNLFTSFGYYLSKKENVQILRSVNFQLRKSGIFVLDFMNVKKIISTLKRNEKKEIDGVKFTIRRSFSGGSIIKKIIIENSGKKEVLKFEERVKAFTRDDFVKFFDQTGFRIIKLFGDYELSKFDEAKSDRLIIIAKKMINIY